MIDTADSCSYMYISSTQLLELWRFAAILCVWSRMQEAELEVDFSKLHATCAYQQTSARISRWRQYRRMFAPDETCGKKTHGKEERRMRMVMETKVKKERGSQKKTDEGKKDVVQRRGLH